MSYSFNHFCSLKLFLEVLDFSFHFEGELLDVFLPFFFELVKLFVVLKGCFLKVFGLHVQLGLQLMNATTVQFFQSGQLVLESIVSDGQVLILMEQVVDLEFSFGEGDFLSTEFVLEFDQLVFELYPSFSLVVEVCLQLVFGLSELMPLVFEHELDLSESSMIFDAI